MSELFSNSGICRCCHARGTFKSLNQLYIYEGRQEVYANMLQQTYNIEIKPAPATLDGYSICDSCIPRLRDAEQFRHQVVSCEQLFHQYYNIHLHRGFEPPDREVKQEIEDPDEQKKGLNLSLDQERSDPKFDEGLFSFRHFFALSKSSKWCLFFH
ncbi:jg15339 [Pararge aegeria aegeria]|uniref:Jg15339 protein n=1 Tax=Pararge aegeria aegeria TaxID=348720 RepID=A0A8S4RJ60_9NEOP|nr:jg15339 [Pararge aegeria aegeria]